MDQLGLQVRPGAESNKSKDQRELIGLVESLEPGARLSKRIPSAPILDQNKSWPNPIVDLALYGEFQTSGKSRDQLLRMVARLNAHPQIELAFLEPVAVPAALGFDAFTGETPASQSPSLATGSRSGNYEELQGYLEAAPLGIGAIDMREVPGQRGAGVTVIDVEGGWLWAHEDLPEPVADLGIHVDDLAWRNHGTAVIGEIRGVDNGFGVTGITPDCMVGNSSIGGSNTAAALAAAIDVLQPGDIILIELHAPGPNSNGEGQFGYLPMEYWQDNFDVIRLATSRGILVCEAAGNGYQNLDDPIYQDLFSRQRRDSGAIMCGATAGEELHSADFSNHGQRVDLNGWGWYVTTTGYGDLFGAYEEEFYTSHFSGTSSASPIVTGSVASLQGMVRQELGFDLDARLARDLLRATGTPMDFGHQIGVRPNLVEAFTLATTSVGEVSGILTHESTGTPLAGIQVQVAGQGSFTMSDTTGFWRLPLQSGLYNLEFSSFLYNPLEQVVTIAPGVSLTLDLGLEPRNLVDIQGVTYAEDLTPLAGVTISPTNQPISGTLSTGDGSFQISDVPSGHIYQMRIDGLVGYGAQVLNVDTRGLETSALVNPVLPAVSQDFESDDGGFTSLHGYWQHGIPPVEVTEGAFDGSLCWGVGMTGNYTDDESDELISPLYDLSGVQGSQHFLSFHYFASTEAGFDGVSLSASSGGEFEVLHPLEDYSDGNLSGLGDMPGWSGHTHRWQGAVFDISEYIGGDFRFRLTWGSDGGLAEQGFYLDSIAFGSGDRLTPVPDQTPALTGGSSLKAWPNPFNPIVTLAYEVTAAGPLNVTVFDVRGRKVKNIWDQAVEATQGELQWDGRDEKGQRVSSGMYFVLLTSRGGPPAVSRVVLSK